MKVRNLGLKEKQRITERAYLLASKVEHRRGRSEEELRLKTVMTPLLGEETLSHKKKNLRRFRYF